MRDFLIYVVGHSIANLQGLHNRCHNIRFNEAVFRVFVYYFSVPGATLDSYLLSSKYFQLCNAPKPDLTLVFMGGNDISQDTVVRELQYKLKRFCQHIEEITTTPAKVFMIEPRNRLRGVDFVTYNGIRNSLNQNLQHEEWLYFPDRIVVTPLRFKYLSPDGVHPGPVGIARLLHRIQRVIGSFFVLVPSSRN